ncbi:MAG: fluoride efflux transporter CrcB [Cytophagales bacterium]|nr:fluoride efflux transporter CrcB [Cytophagales bacterium]
MLKDILIVFIGGGVGSVVRYLLNKYLSQVFAHFPLHTFIANVLACAIYGALAAWIYQSTQDRYKLWILTGFCGGLSTYSTFNYEIIEYIKNGQYIAAIIYILVTLIIGVGVFWGAELLVKS